MSKKIMTFEEFKEKRKREVRGKVRDLYMNSGIGMEEILEVLAYDACHFTDYEGGKRSMYNFWNQVEIELRKWKEAERRKNALRLASIAGKYRKKGEYS